MKTVLLTILCSPLILLCSCILGIIRFFETIVDGFICFASEQPGKKND